MLDPVSAASSDSETLKQPITRFNQLKANKEELQNEIKRQLEWLKTKLQVYFDELEDQVDDNLSNKNVLHADWIIKDALSFDSVINEMIIVSDDYNFENDKTLS